MITPLAALPKVLIVDLSLIYGGSSSRVLSLMQHSPAGKIALAGLRGSAITQHAARLGLPVNIVGETKTDLQILPNLRRLIRAEGYQVLDAQNIQSKFWASCAAHFTEVALVSTIHSWYANEHGRGSRKGKFYTRLELATNRRLDLYITVSEQDRRELLRAGLKEDAIKLIYNAVSVEPSAIGGDGEWLRKKFNLPSDAVVCAAIGRLVPVKGYDVLIEAMQQCAPRIPALVCLIVGEGECQAALTRQIEDAGLQARVRLTGYFDREAVLQIIKASDIFAMPSRYEGTPIALLEAAALGLPILASASGGIPELVTHGEHALLVAPDDPAALANGLTQLCGDFAFARTLGANAQARIRRVFNLETQVAVTWNAYQTARQRHATRV